MIKYSELYTVITQPMLATRGPLACSKPKLGHYAQLSVLLDLGCEGDVPENPSQEPAWQSEAGPLSISSHN